jgi:hypothetical protein
MRMQYSHIVPTIDDESTTVHKPPVNLRRPLMRRAGSLIDESPKTNRQDDGAMGGSILDDSRVTQ